MRSALRLRAAPRHSLLATLDVVGGLLKLGSKGDRAWCLHGVLPYKDLGHEPTGMAVTADELEALLDTADKRGVKWTPLDGLVGAKECSWPRWSLTFDDASVSFLEFALPILARRGVPATVFACTDYAVHGGGRWPDYPPSNWVRPMQRDELTGLASEGIRIASHGHEHVDLRALSHAEISAGLRRSRAFVDDLPNGLPFLAFPFGFANQHVRQVAVESGFPVMFGVAPGRSREVTLSTSPMSTEVSRPLYGHQSKLRRRSVLAGGDELRVHLRGIKAKVSPC